MNRLRQEEGEDTAVHAAGYMAVIEAFTKVIDSSGRVPTPKVWRVVVPGLDRMRKLFANNNSSNNKNRRQ